MLPVTSTAPDAHAGSTYACAASSLGNSISIMTSPFRCASNTSMTYSYVAPIYEWRIFSTGVPTASLIRLEPYLLIQPFLRSFEERDVARDDVGASLKIVCFACFHDIERLIKRKPQCLETIVYLIPHKMWSAFLPSHRRIVTI